MRGEASTNRVARGFQARAHNKDTNLLVIDVLHFLGPVEETEHLSLKLQLRLVLRCGHLDGELLLDLFLHVVLKLSPPSET